MSGLHRTSFQLQSRSVAHINDANRVRIYRSRLSWVDRLDYRDHFFARLLIAAIRLFSRSSTNASALLGRDADCHSSITVAQYTVAPMRAMVTKLTKLL